jgi:hypothetical protein
MRGLKVLGLLFSSRHFVWDPGLQRSDLDYYALTPERLVTREETEALLGKFRRSR